ncbi:MAG: glycosyltransferase family 4 protein, partial [Anaerolineae bacterium]|nr:glycosyltransferase family 4 protein [Anaerolineae bacterium]
MKIVAFSINPLFPDLVMGGATKHLQSIAIHLGELGHEVTVLCTRRADSSESFRWHERVAVLPILPFHQPFPQPYAIPAYDMAAIVQDVGEHLQTADRFYMHDGEFLFPFAYRHVPTVVSLRDNVYPETLHGSFLFQGDRLILISENSRQYFLHTAGRFFPDYAARTTVIHNGVDWNHFKPTPPDKILDLIPVKPGDYPMVLHPHRPEETKGIRETLAVADLLVHQYAIHDLKVLVPKWLDLTFSPDLRQFYKSIQIEIAQRGLTDHVIFHDWIPQSLMPEYYSLGTVTLALGSFVESFGNSVYESLGCGTPAIPARISSHREILPENLVDKVDFGDVEAAARIAADIIREGRRTPPETIRYLHEHYSVEQQRTAYADAILSARRMGELRYQLTPLDAQTCYTLPPWCYQAARGIYHDFRAGYLQASELEKLLEVFPEGFTWAEAQSQGIGQEAVMQ